MCNILNNDEGKKGQKQAFLLKFLIFPLEFMEIKQTNIQQLQNFSVNKQILFFNQTFKQFFINKKEIFSEFFQSFKKFQLRKVILANFTRENILNLCSQVADICFLLFCLQFLKNCFTLGNFLIIYKWWLLAWNSSRKLLKK